MVNDIPDGYGHGLPFIYLMWATVLVILYFPCRWFMGVKAAAEGLVAELSVRRVGDGVLPSFTLRDSPESSS